MSRLIIGLIVAPVVTLATMPAFAQGVLDPFNCAAQGMQVGGGYECAPQGVAVLPPTPADVAHVYQGGYHWYWYPESGWWYQAEDGYLYPD